MTDDVALKALRKLAAAASRSIGPGLNSMRFWLGVHRPQWLAQTDVGLFVSRRVLAGRSTLPRAAGEWVLDSGGFTELSRYGHWTITLGDYSRELTRYRDEIGGLAWAAPMDWMCEPSIVAKTGLSVREHQERTVANFLSLRARHGSLVIPVLQGWLLADYHVHVSDYASAGVDLEDEPLVGVGSVCRRGSDGEIGRILRSLEGLRTHAFGVRGRALADLAPLLTSADSMAWSYAASMEALRRRTFCDRRGLAHDDPMRFGSCGKRSCANCLHEALRWRGERLNDLNRLELTA